MSQEDFIAKYDAGDLSDIAISESVPKIDLKEAHANFVVATHMLTKAYGCYASELVDLLQVEDDIQNAVTGKEFLDALDRISPSPQ